MILHISETLNVSHCLGDALPEYLWITFRPHVSGPPAKLHAHLKLVDYTSSAVSQSCIFCVY